MVLDNLHGPDLTQVTAAFEAMRSQGARLPAARPRGTVGPSVTNL
jgi:hypothetical protein